MLYDPLGVDPSAHWRDFAAVRQQDTVSFAITGMPIGLDSELRRRAAAYGMTVDQFVIAILGHLAWRTPFAEDIEPWGSGSRSRRPTVPDGSSACCRTLAARTVRSTDSRRPVEARWMS